MADPHRTNVLVTSCLKTPVDPHTKAPLASYERDRVLPYAASARLDNRHYEKELEYEDSGSDFCDEVDYLGKGGPSHRLLSDYRAAAARERLDLSDIFFSNEEYYSKLEELKKAHLRTMAELESMYRRKLELKFMEPLDVAAPDTGGGGGGVGGGHRSAWSNISPAAGRRLRKAHSAVELRRSSGQSEESYEEEEGGGGGGGNEVEKGLLFSPKEHIKNMWKDFKLSQQALSSSLNNLPAGGDARKRKKKKTAAAAAGESWKHRVTVPKPFHMTQREAERRKHGVKTRSEMEVENAELRRQLDELTECQRKFHASPVPAHVHLPLYEELQEQYHERRRNIREQRGGAGGGDEEQQRTVPKPFSFLERERLKKEQKKQAAAAASGQDKVKPFRAKPVPKAVYAAASGEQAKEEQLYRSIKIQMRAQELLHSAAMPTSMLQRRLSDRRKKEDGGGDGGGGGGFTHRPTINKEVPDFNASFQRFQKQLERRKEVKPTTACEPFDLRTAQIPSHRDRILADIQKEQSSPRPQRWPYVSAGLAAARGTGGVRTPNSSLCSSLSGSLEMLPAKGTDATKKRHEAVRRALEQRRRAEEEEEQWRERQKQRERRLQKEVLRRAQANDPHTALAQTHSGKLKEFRKQEQQRRKEFQQEMKEMQRRVKGRPLLLEQVAQRNAKQAAEKRYADALQGCELSQEFISSKAAASGGDGGFSDHTHSDQDDADMGYLPVHYRKVFLDDDDDDTDDPEEKDRGREDEEDDEASLKRRDDEDKDEDEEERGRRSDGERRYSDDSYHYSDDHDNYSEDSEHDADTRREEEEQQEQEEEKEEEEQEKGAKE